MDKYAAKGFTLVELIIVIILLAIVTVYAASRYFGVGSFAAYTAQEQTIAVIRQVQLSRMQANIADLNSYCDSPAAPSELKQHCLRSRLSIQTGLPSCIGSSLACSLTTEQRSDVMLSDQVTVSVTPNVTDISFDMLGNPQGAAAGGITLTLTASDSQTRVCINAQGYVSGGC
ncbi:prepilin-type N-terminal cleavage/methylation domain-containing protein [Vibrio sp.]|uniref:prepilin-type N-terminal cleavage/methylation domain-containing protein n=1 Tax=Vibrio sp. TaxID=678 RepID=UPI003D140987